ncbi:MAG: C25 family cysteine peptidase [Candidatus Zixiibacteriota bacterium]
MRGRLIFGIALILVSAALPAAGATLNCSVADVAVNQHQLRVSYPDCESIVVGGKVTLPAKHLLIPLETGFSARMLKAESDESSATIGSLPCSRLFDDQTTSLDNPRILSSETNAQQIGAEPIYVIGEREIQGVRYAEFYFFPVTINAQGELLFHSQTNLVYGSAIVANSACKEFTSIDPVRTTFSQALAGTTDLVDYVIVTNAQLADAFSAAARHKNETGYHAQVKLIEEVLATYSGVDNAEKLRNYLKDFYAAGGKYVLLGGDETILPIRYAYHLTADTTPALADQQICDLYFADLVGDWDHDHDGVYGERYDDAPDLTPELMVGRLPFHTVDQVNRYIAKLIRYESDPGHGDLSYLTRSFLFSSDQMRDWTPISQQSRVAATFPESFTIDTVNGVEESRGDDAAPSNLSPKQLRPVLTSGFGIVNVIAHGRSDGFAVKTSGYNTNPKQYLLAGAQSGESDCFDSIQAPNMPAFFYSLGCDNGAFDKDQAPFNIPGDCFAENVLGETDGAVAMIANSRWGWVSSSYLLQTAFYDSLFAHPDRSAASAMYSAKSVYSYYRDLIYGQNFFGDPSLRVYTSTPARQALAVATTGNGISTRITANGQPVAGSSVTLSSDGVLLSTQVTDINGAVAFVLPNSSGDYVISSAKPGLLTARTSYSGSIVTDYNDNDNVPYAFSLAQNYPNPFNPVTLIGYSLASRESVKLEVIDLLGRTVTTLVSGVQSAGDHEVVWNGNAVASGVYFYRLTAGSHCETKKMILLK